MVFNIQPCRACDKDYRPRGPRTFYCDDCRILRKREWKSKYGKSEKGKENRRKWDKTELSKARYRRYRIKIRERSRLRYRFMPDNERKARYYVTNAVRDGRLTRSKYCEVCKRKEWGKKRSMIEAHHYKGYEPENWLKVQWLCAPCHRGGGAVWRVQ